MASNNHKALLRISALCALFIANPSFANGLSSGSTSGSSSSNPSGNMGSDSKMGTTGPLDATRSDSSSTLETGNDEFNQNQDEQNAANPEKDIKKKKSDATTNSYDSTTSGSTGAGSMDDSRYPSSTAPEVNTRDLDKSPMNNRNEGTNLPPETTE